MADQRGPRDPHRDRGVLNRDLAQYHKGFLRVMKRENQALKARKFAQLGGIFGCNLAENWLCAAIYGPQHMPKKLTQTLAVFGLGQ